MTATPEHTAHCLRCGRRITSARAIATGYGPGCLVKIRKAAASGLLADYSTRQREDATELVELGGVVPLRRRVFLTVGSHGETYRTAATGQCNCRSGLAGRRCYHGAAALMVAA